MKNRKQYVTINQETSTQQTVEYGVPQGSTLRPFLFLLYINDLPNSISSVPRLFADDTCLIVKDADLDCLEYKLNSELDGVKTWINANTLTINASKSNLLIIPPKAGKHLKEINVFYNNTKIIAVDSAKYLGILIDKHLSFEPHINALWAKLSRSVGIMSKLKHLLPSKTLLQLYYTMVHPRLLYGLVVWGSTYKSYINKLGILQNKAVRIVAGGNWSDHVTPFYKKLNILKIKDLYNYEIAKFMHKYHNKSLPGTFATYLKKCNNVYSRTTRNAVNHDCYFVPRYNTSKLQRCIKYTGVKIWNSVSTEIRKTSFNSFKRKYKNVVLDNY